MHPWELQLLQLTTALRVWLLESIDVALRAIGRQRGEQWEDWLG
jgi:hypothetical protein